VLISLDIETSCGVGCSEQCDHALDPYRNKIDLIGLYWKETENENFVYFDSYESFQEFNTLHPEARYLGFNIKFDAHTLHTKGVNILDKIEHDALLMATVHTEKVPPQYQDWYESERREKNKSLPKGYSHRQTKGHSLKILAPYFLGVEPFWEDPTNHNNTDYLKKDVMYTMGLYEFFTQKLIESDNYTFYKEKMMRWDSLLLQMEIKGIKIDLDLMSEEEKKSDMAQKIYKQVLDDIWAPAYEAYRQLKINELEQEYKDMAAKAIAKLPAPTQEKMEKVGQRYQILLNKAASKLDTSLNLDSPSQLKWLLKDYLKLDITDFHDEESTGKPVLKKLSDGRKDIDLFLKYRAERKLITAFYPSYREMHVDGIMHANFKPFVARTGRLSSSHPNLQQVPRNLHKLFMARPGHSLIVKDQSAIEPRLIAYTSEDSVLFTILDKGLDFHGYNSRIFFDLKCEVNDVKKLYPLEREVGKEVGLAILYGAGAYRLQESAQKRGFVWDLAECQSKVSKFREAYFEVDTYRKQLNDELKKGPLTNVLGRPFFIEDKEDIYMKGFNTFIQGSASDLVLHSAYRMQKEFNDKGLGANVLLLVHDEIVVEAPHDSIKEAEDIMERCMTDYRLETKWGLIKLATEGKVGERWEK